MSAKTITIDTEAYNRLKKVMLADESFSAAIKRNIKPPVDVKKLRRTLEKMSDEAVDAVAEQVASRGKRPRTRKVA